MNIKFKKAAELGDTFDVVTTFASASAYRGVFKQRIERGDDVIVEADVEIVCLNKARVVREFPNLAP